MSDQGIEERILSILGEEGPLTTQTLAARLHISRNTAAKYLSILQNKALVWFKEVGPSKLWTATGTGAFGKRVFVLHASFDEMVAEAFDEGMSIVLGGSVKQSVYFHLFHDKSYMVEDIIRKPELLEKGLRSFFGRGADVIIALIIVGLASRTGRKITRDEAKSLSLSSYVANLRRELESRQSKGIESTN